jgi:hypothetical protein
LKDKASEYYALCLERDPDISFKSLIAKVEKRFDRKDLPETAQIQFYTLKQASDEELEDWAERVTKTAVIAFEGLPDDYVEKQMVLRFCQGCKNREAAQYAANLRLHTLEKAIDAIRTFLHNTQAVYGKSRREVRRISADSDDERFVPKVRQTHHVDAAYKLTEKVSGMEKRFDGMEQRFEKLMISMNNLTEVVQRRGRSPISPSRSRTACFGCGQLGHYKSECPQNEHRTRGRSPSPGNSPSRSWVECFQCGKLGHYKSECPTKHDTFNVSPSPSLNSKGLDLKA